MKIPLVLNRKNRILLSELTKTDFKESKMHEESTIHAIVLSLFAFMHLLISTGR